MGRVIHRVLCDLYVVCAVHGRCKHMPRGGIPKGQYVRDIVINQCYSASNPFFKSSIMSSTFSRPTERRTKPSEIPCSSSSSFE